MDKKIRKAIFAGSFDPITNGHLDIISRASKLFDELQIGVLINPNKKGLFSLEERVELINACTKDLDNIKVTGYNYVGALFGSTRGTVRDIYASNLNISGNNYIGGIGGDINTNSPRPTSMIISANVEGNSYVGITTGSSYLGIEQIAIIGGSVKGSSYVGRLSGNTVSWNDTYALETIPNGNGGKDCWKTIPSDANLSDLSIYKNMNIDTSLTGDTDGVGYYFDVDKNGNIFVTK